MSRMDSESIGRSEEAADGAPSDGRDAVDIELGRALREWGQLITLVAQVVVLLASGKGGRQLEAGFAVLPKNDRELWMLFRRLYAVQLQPDDVTSSQLNRLSADMEGLFRTRNNIVHPWWSWTDDGLPVGMKLKRSLVGEVGLDDSVNAALLQQYQLDVRAAYSEMMKWRAFTGEWADG
jgi:hypothetical protein